MVRTREDPPLAVGGTIWCVFPSFFFLVLPEFFSRFPLAERVFSRSAPIFQEEVI